MGSTLLSTPLPPSGYSQWDNGVEASYPVLVCPRGERGQPILYKRRKWWGRTNRRGIIKTAKVGHPGECQHCIAMSGSKQTAYNRFINIIISAKLFYLDDCILALLASPTFVYPGSFKSSLPPTLGLFYTHTHTHTHGRWWLEGYAHTHTHTHPHTHAHTHTHTRERGT